MPEPKTATPFPLLAAAAKRQADELHESANRIKDDGQRMGLGQLVIDRRGGELRDEAVVFDEIHRILTGLAPLEPTIRTVLWRGS
jgi:hypothetical protein